MTLKDIAAMFNRSLLHAFSMKKFFCLFATLVVSGVFILFFGGLSSYSVSWMKLPLQFIPLFLIIGLVMAAGIFLIRLYEKELVGEKSAVWQTIGQSWDVLLKAAYLALPLLFAFFICWVLIGILMLLKSIPFLGHILGILLAFVPFVLNFAIILLFLIALLAFFFLAPSLAGTNRFEPKAIYHRLRADLFSNLLLLGIAYLPVWIVWKFVKYALLMTLQLYSSGDSQVEMLLQGFFILFPLVAILTPAVTFFFNFSYEAYLSLAKDQKERV